MPKVTVVVPIYNVEAYVRKCVDSILAQSFSDFELILVDDGSTDGCGDICDSYAKKDGRIRVIHQKNTGLGGARNTGMKASAGEYILFVDSDDSIGPKTLEVTCGKAAESDADMVIFGYQSEDENGQALQVFLDSAPKNQPLSPTVHKEILLSSPTACNKLCKKELFEKSGLLYPSKVWYEDIRTSTKLYFFAEKIVFIDDIFYHYFIRPGSIMQNKNIERNAEIIAAFQDLVGYFKENGRFEEFHDELEYLCIYHLYIAASVRVIRADRKHRLTGEFQSYMKETFPGFQNNPYLPKLTSNQSIVYHLLLKKRYRTIGWIFRIKSS